MSWYQTSNTTYRFIVQSTKQHKLVSLESFFIVILVSKEMPAKELTEAYCSSKHSCSKLLLIDVTFIRFSDKMLFTLTTLKNL